MPLTPRNDVNFKRNLIDIIKFSYDNDISRPFISNNKLLIGYGFSLKDDIELICAQIYKNNKDKVIKDVKQTIANTTSKTTIEKIKGLMQSLEVPILCLSLNLARKIS